MNAPLDLPALIILARKTGSTDVHVSTTAAPRLRTAGLITEVPGARIPTREDLVVALAAVTSATSPGVGEQDFMVTVGDQVCRVVTFENAVDAGLVIRLMPEKGWPVRHQDGLQVPPGPGSPTESCRSAILVMS